MARNESHLNYALIGYGKMGKLIETALLKKGHKLVAIADTRTPISKAFAKADIVLDFSHPKAVLGNIKKVASLKKPIVVGTTGWEKDMAKAKTLVSRAKTALLYSPNFSFGVFYFLKIVEKIAELSSQFPEYEIQGVESHHKHKVDAPSGTAKKMISYFKKKIPITSVRVGSVPGKHTLLLDSFCDTITITHEARSREGFAEGAILAGEWIMGKKGWFTLDDILKEGR